MPSRCRCKAVGTKPPLGSRKRRRGELILKEELLDSLVTAEAGLFPIDKRTVSGQTPRGGGGLLLSQQLGHMVLRLHGEGVPARQDDVCGVANTPYE